MTLVELLVQYYQKAREVAGTPDALNQCVDWANSYIKDVLNLPIIEWTDAKDFPSKAGDKYDYIKSTPTNFPSFGDIVVWNGNIGGGHGHIAIALGGDANTFVSTDENWSVSQRVTVERHNYDNVDGWLHPKQSLISTGITLDKPTFEKLVSNSTEYDKFVTEGYRTVIDVKKTLDALTGSLAISQEANRELMQRISELNKEITDLKNIPPIIQGATHEFGYNKDDIVLDKPLGMGLRVIKYA